MNTIRLNLGSKVDKVNIYPLADLHVGSKFHLNKKLKQDIEVIKNDKNGYVILNGDLINNALKNSVSDIYEELMNPEDTLDYLVELLTPIKDKIIGVVSGNHESRTYKQTGLRPLKNLCYRLGVMDKFSDISNLILLSFGKNKGRTKTQHTFKIYQTHGRGGGKLVGSKANRVHNLSNIIVNADVYIHSHTHTPITFKDSYMLIDSRNKGLSQQDRLYVNTNAYEGFGGYGEVIGLAPSNHDMVKIVLDTSDGKNVKALL